MAHPVLVKPCLAELSQAEPSRGNTTLSRIASEDQYGPVQSAEVACLVKSWDKVKDEEIATINRAIVSSVLTRAQRHDNLWFTMASNEMGLSETVLRNYASQRNNLSLVVLGKFGSVRFGAYLPEP